MADDVDGHDRSELVEFWSRRSPNRLSLARGDVTRGCFGSILTRSPSRRRTIAICAKRPTKIDVKPAFQDREVRGHGLGVPGNHAG